MSISRTGTWLWVGCAASIVTVLYSGSAIAELTSGDKFPKVLNDIKRATGVCKRDDVPSGLVGALAASQFSIDLGCAIPSSQVQSLLIQSNPILADLRPGADYQTFHIESALTLTSADLHAKPYWHDKTVVLIGNGKAERELYGECARLKQSGYRQVRVLRGGMPQWLAHHQPVTGRAPSASQLMRLSASEFWLESQNVENLVVLGKEQSALKGDLSFSVVLPQTTGEAIMAVLNRRSKELKNAPLMSVVLAAAPNITEEQMLRLQKAVMPLPLLVYSDTRDAFVRQLAVQKAVWKAQASGPKQPGCGL